RQNSPRERFRTCVDAALQPAQGRRKYDDERGDAIENPPARRVPYNAARTDRATMSPVNRVNDWLSGAAGAGVRRAWTPATPAKTSRRPGSRRYPTTWAPAAHDPTHKRVATATVTHRCRRERARKTRAPSICHAGSRLSRLMKPPVCPSADHTGSRVARKIP